MARALYIHTFGCQMNESDSRRMAESLVATGWTAVENAEQADLILLNTCAIRERAEQKMYSALGRYRDQKDARGALIGVAGCVAQQEKANILKRAPYVDFVLGPDNLAALPGLVDELDSGHRGLVRTDWMDGEAYLFPRADPEAARGQATAFVTAMKGCDNVCSFCVVPRTRGRELSRPYPEVVREVADLCAVGVREVTLIGQNVNSYQGGCDFPTLLRRVGAVPGLLRLRFTTSHPQDCSAGLLECFAPPPRGVDALCAHFHLPVQSGSDRVLERMRRRYTVVEYLAKIDALRAIAPHVALTTDIIVGFPGETEEDFEATLDLVQRVRFENIYGFAYSSRPHTAARLREREWGIVPEEIKAERLQRLLTLQRSATGARMAELLGRELEVLVEGASRTDADRRTGHTTENRRVNFVGDAPAGTLAKVRVVATSAASLAGEQVGTAFGPRPVDPPSPRPSTRSALPVLLS
jgi:tRNA-2-methylthio-N6-dimethylallyladenosine synthase